jgi:hypothetical protein
MNRYRNRCHNELAKVAFARLDLDPTRAALAQLLPAVSDAEYDLSVESRRALSNA